MQAALLIQSTAASTGTGFSEILEVHASIDVKETLQYMQHKRGVAVVYARTANCFAPETKQDSPEPQLLGSPAVMDPHADTLWRKQGKGPGGHRAQLGAPAFCC